MQKPYRRIQVRKLEKADRNISWRKMQSLIKLSVRSYCAEDEKDFSEEINDVNEGER